MPPTEVPTNKSYQVTTSRDYTQHCYSPPMVETPSPRVGQATPRVPSPRETPNAHRGLSSTIKTPRTIPAFDLYQKQKQNLRHTHKNTAPPVPQRVVDYLGENTRHLLADLQAETGRYYRTRSTARQEKANAVKRFVPATDTNIDTA
jgi:hypothetical protein